MIDVIKVEDTALKSIKAKIDKNTNSLEDLEKQCYQLAKDISQSIPFIGEVIHVQETQIDGAEATEVWINLGRYLGVEKEDVFEVFTPQWKTTEDGKRYPLPSKIIGTIEIFEVDYESAKGIVVKQSQKVLRIHENEDLVRKVILEEPKFIESPSEDTKTSANLQYKYGIYIWPFAGRIDLALGTENPISYATEKFRAGLVESERFDVKVGTEDQKIISEVDVLDTRSIVKRTEERWEKERILPADYIVVGKLWKLKEDSTEIHVEVTARLIDVIKVEDTALKSIKAKIDKNTNSFEDLGEQCFRLGKNISQIIPLIGKVTQVLPTQKDGVEATEVWINLGKNRKVEQKDIFEVYTPHWRTTPDGKRYPLPAIVRCKIEIFEVDAESAKGIVELSKQVLRIQPREDLVREFIRPPEVSIEKPSGKVQAGETYTIIIRGSEGQRVPADNFDLKFTPGLGTIKKEQGEIQIKIADVKQPSIGTLEAVSKDYIGAKASKDIIISLPSPPLWKRIVKHPVTWTIIGSGITLASVLKIMNREKEGKVTIAVAF